MQRRTLFKTLASNAALLLMPKWGRAQMAAASAGVSLEDVAVVVLPASLGPQRIAEVAKDFERWLNAYPVGADTGYGYGITKLTVLGPSPAKHYAEQLKALDTAAEAQGGKFSSLSLDARRAIVQAALTDAAATAIPMRPNGKHVATDLMSHFYRSSDGHDFCYNLAIRESDCRGLTGSDKRPAPLS
jgi:hypothetical protein